MPTPFQEALAHLAAKRVLPTDLDSAGLRELDAGLRRQSLFSARTMIEEYLDDVKAKVESVLSPVQAVREGQDQTVTEGYNPATARAAMREELKRLGYAPSEDEAGTIKDLSSDARLNLVVKTNVELAQGAGHFVQQNDPAVVDLYPALELIRFEQKEKERDWAARWRFAAREAGDLKAYAALELHGRMVALKSSGIWKALGDGAGGYSDSLGNPFPPFAFNSGMWTQDVGRADATDLGLIQPGQTAEPAEFDLATLFTSPEEAAA